VKAKDRNEKYEIIKEMKINTSIEDLVKMDMKCIKISGSQIKSQRQSGILEDDIDVPIEFIDFMNYCRMLKFDEKPDYNSQRRRFKDLFNRMGYEYDYVFDW